MNGPINYLKTLSPAEKRAIAWGIYSGAATGVFCILAGLHPLASITSTFVVGLGVTLYQMVRG
jgi:hypothetical protein